MVAVAGHEASQRPLPNSNMRRAPTRPYRTRALAPHSACTVLYGEVSSTFTAGVLQAVVSSPFLVPGFFAPGAHELAEPWSVGTAALLTAAKRHLDSREETGPSKRMRLVRKQPATWQANPHKDRVSANPKGKVRCPRCGNVVRRDVIARHWKTNKCVAAWAAKQRSDNTEQCRHCGVVLAVSNLRRHWRSAQCLHARSGALASTDGSSDPRAQQLSQAGP